MDKIQRKGGIGIGIGRVLFIFLFFLWINGCASQRNAEAEGFCQPFLTSPKTSPISAANRNIRVDEDGEFNCELVLQDR